MWPWGHLAVAYLIYTGYSHRRADHPPRALPMIALAIGSQFPDLIDKPFAWSLEILPGGRTLAHSVFVAALLLPAAYSLARRVDRPEIGTAFAIGHVSHLLADVPPSAILSGDLGRRPSCSGPSSSRRRTTRSTGFSPVSCATRWDGSNGSNSGSSSSRSSSVWYRDGTPGLGAVWRGLERAVETAS